VIGQERGATAAVTSGLPGHKILQTWANRRIDLSYSSIANATRITHTKANPRVMPVFSIGYVADFDNTRAIGPDLAAQYASPEEAAGSRILA